MEHVEVTKVAFSKSACVRGILYIGTVPIAEGQCLEDIKKDIELVATNAISLLSHNRLMAQAIQDIKTKHNVQITEEHGELYESIYHQDLLNTPTAIKCKVFGSDFRDGDGMYRKVYRLGSSIVYYVHTMAYDEDGKPISSPQFSHGCGYLGEAICNKVNIFIINQ